MKSQRLALFAFSQTFRVQDDKRYPLTWRRYLSVDRADQPEGRVVVGKKLYEADSRAPLTIAVSVFLQSINGGARGQLEIMRRGCGN